jgi:hypothetical protein
MDENEWVEMESRTATDTLDDPWEQAILRIGWMAQAERLMVLAMGYVRLRRGGASLHTGVRRSAGG